MKQIIWIMLIAILISCRGQGSQYNVANTVMSSIETLDEANELPECLNSVKGHKEERGIVGNFTGFGIDTIYVVEEKIDSIYDMLDGYKFYAKS